MSFTHHDRESLISKHPVLTLKYTVPTPTIEQIYSIVRERVWMHRPSMYMYARPRMGKSTCAAAVKALLNAEFPEKYVVILSADPTRKSTLAKDLATECGLHLGPRDTPSRILDLLITHICCEAQAINGDHFILEIDEMQALQGPQYNELLLLQNRLQLRGIKLTTIGFAQPDINNERSALLVAGATNLIARFLSEPIIFKGCDDMAWLARVLRSFDEDLQYPEGGCSYTEFFFPEAYSSGMRLIQSLELIWGAITELAGKGGTKNFQVEQVFRILQEMLVSMRRKDCDSFKITKSDIDDVIEKLNILATIG